MLRLRAPAYQLGDGRDAEKMAGEILRRSNGGHCLPCPYRDSRALVTAGYFIIGGKPLAGEPERPGLGENIDSRNR